MERSAAIDDAISIPIQEPGNAKTNLVYMTVQKAEGFIASDQTGKFPRISNKGNQYIYVFNIYAQTSLNVSRSRAERRKTY